MFETLLERLETSERDKVKADRKELDDILEMIHLKSAEEYEVGRAIVDHWYKAVKNSNYRKFAYRGEDKATPLERSGLDFSGKHAFVVLGYQLRNGEMTEELKGRCDAAAAAARSFSPSRRMSRQRPLSSLMSTLKVSGIPALREFWPLTMDS